MQGVPYDFKWLSMIQDLNGEKAPIREAVNNDEMLTQAFCVCVESMADIRVIKRERFSAKPVDLSL